jgi:hypothetical protein
LKGNPGGFKLSPKPEKVQVHLEKESERKAQEEHRRQAQIELGLQGKLFQRIEREREDERLDKEAKEEP